MRIFKKISSNLLSLIPRTRADLYSAGLLKSHCLDDPVLSVGNLTVGGTGKTPFVAYLAGLIKKFGKKPIILSRGYRGTAESSNLIVTDGHGIFCTPEECGDEPYLLARKLKGVTIIVGKNRLASSNLIPSSSDARPVFILDDGYQYLRLKRDINLVLLDGTNPFGQDALFPFGQLREPFSAIRRADAVIITRSHQMKIPKEIILQRVKRFNPDGPVFLFGQSTEFMVSPFSRKKRPIQSLSGKSVVALAGIGNPSQFLKDLGNAGLKINEQLLYRDHHPYAQSDIDTVVDMCRTMKIEAIVTTEKDLIRLEALKLPDNLIWAAQLVIREDPPETFKTWLVKKLETVDTT